MTGGSPRGLILAAGLAAALVLAVALARPAASAGGGGDGSGMGVPVDVPGPSWLHAPLASTPIVENTGGWRADPLLVSGADAYVAGEYLHQDWVYDAHGADTTDAPLVPPDTSPSSLLGLAGAPTGDIAQPSDGSVFGWNAADLLEFRARLGPRGRVVYRFTLKTMLAPDVTAVAVGIDTDGNPSTGRDDWGFGLGELGDLGLDHVLVSWGTGAELDGEPVPSAVDVDRNQIEVTVPLRPGSETWRHYLVVGVWDNEAGAFAPVGELPDDRSPGGAHGTSPPPALNVGFRSASQEPMGVDAAETGGRGAYGWGSWREHAQAKALADRDISAFHTDIDFAKLQAPVSESRVPDRGYLNRLVVSHLDLGEGVDSGGTVLLGRVQPYAIYVPSAYDPARPAPLTLLLHAAACNYNQYGVQAPQMLEQLGEARDSIVVTAQARGPLVGYGDIGEVDVFEVLADVATRYAVDFERIYLSGISMGGAGAFRLASLYPDLFVRAFPVAGTGSAVADIAENVRNVPLLMWNGVPDELVPITSYLPYQQRLEQLGYRHQLDMFPARDHLVRPLGTGTDFSRGAQFLGTDPVDRDPRRVTYRVIPGMANPALDLSYRGAYWVGDMEVSPGRSSGTVDVTSHAGRAGEPHPLGFTRVDDDPEPHVQRGVAWMPAWGAPANALTATLTGVRRVRLDLARAGYDAGRAGFVQATTDASTSLSLAGVGPGTTVLLNGAPAGKAGRDGTTVDLPPGENRVDLLPVPPRSAAAP